MTKAPPMKLARVGPVVAGVAVALVIAACSKNVAPLPETRASTIEDVRARAARAEQTLDRETSPAKVTSTATPEPGTESEPSASPREPAAPMPGGPQAGRGTTPQATPPPVQQPRPAPEPFTKPQWVNASGAAYLQGRTETEAEQLALRNALANAVRIAAGENVDVRETQIITETDDQVREAFIRLSQTRARGYVTQYEVKWETGRIENPDPARPPILGYIAHVRAYVVPPQGETDPAFWLTARLNHATFRDGEEVILTVRASQDAYLTVLNVWSNGEIAVLIPSPYLEDRRLPANRDVTFPPEQARTRGIHLRARLPRDTKPVAESFLVVATKEDVPPPQPETGDVLTLEDVNRWLVQIPEDRRAEDVVGFDIRRR